MTKARFACVLAAAAFAANCGSGYSSPSSPSPSGGGGGTTSGNVVTITIKGVNGKQSFDPNPASVPAGQMVVFKNIDSVTHHVMLDDRSVDAGNIAPGASSSPLALGGVNASYHCANHPSMVGSLNSTPTPEPPPCTGYCG